MSSPTRLTKTLLYALLEAQATSNVDYRYFMNTTLNSKYTIEETREPAVKPTLNYFGIGISGFRNIDGLTLAAPYEPNYSHMDLFQSIPFRCVPIDNDLTDAERTNYRMRVRIQVDGLGEFWAYYLKKINYASDSVQIIETDETTGIEEVVESLDSSKWLNPDPADARTTNEAAVATTKFRSVVKDGLITITGAEVVEAINILFGGNLLRARVSELGFYSGSDELITVSNNAGGTMDYMEAIYAQLAFHYTSTGSDFSDTSKISNNRLRTSSAEAFLL